MSDEIENVEGETPQVETQAEPTGQMSENELTQVTGGSKITQEKNDMQKGIIANIRV